MKKILSGFAFALTATFLVSSMATATTFTGACNATPVINQDVMNITSSTLGGLTFSSFMVNGAPPPGTTVFMTGGTSTSAVTDMFFQMASSWNGNTVTAADTILTYAVSGPGNIVGVNNIHSGGPGVVIQEIVCTVAFVNNNCDKANQLTNFANPPTSSGSFVAQSTIYILKDISQKGDFAGISGFENDILTSSSTASSAPEPATLSMMGIGLLGLGLIGRRKRKA